MCISNQLRYKDVKRCLGGLYHVASKGVHSRSSKVVIDAREWDSTDVVVLAAVFQFYKIPYDYYDTNGHLVENHDKSSHQYEFFNIFEMNEMQK